MRDSASCDWLLSASFVSQHPEGAASGELQHAAAGPRRKLHGRFLHITDIHPDPFYAAGTSEKSACHRKKPKKARPRAGQYGMPYSECDSPLSLTNLTLDYIDKEWADEVDFVVWTGDSARHDNDRKQPRTLKEIYQLNRAMARRMEEIFVKRGVPVIPSIVADFDLNVFGLGFGFRLSLCFYVAVYGAMLSSSYVAAVLCSARPFRGAVSAFAPLWSCVFDWVFCRWPVPGAFPSLRQQRRLA
ncbi:hypothetical protein EIP86_001770 [Pleurotus ostreatoroseus]|nr:hypothetical protein EIP86_001770 [Pleurotus ostreatoroseus]